MIRPTGFFSARAWASVTSCSGQAGVRVQIGFTPRASAVVGVSSGGRARPGRIRVRSFGSVTSKDISLPAAMPFWTRIV